MLKTVSVGFIPLKRNDQDYKIIEKAELLEVSFVAVPANPNAISMDKKLYDEAVSK
jgi:phage head maturation protease